VLIGPLPSNQEKRLNFRCAKCPMHQSMRMRIKAFIFSLRVMAEALWANIGSKSAISLQRGPVDPQFQVEGFAPTNHSSQKTRLNDLSYGIKTWTDLSSVLSQCTRLTDRRTDAGRTEFSSLDRVCIACSAVKMSSFGLNIAQLLPHILPCKTPILGQAALKINANIK